MLTRADWAGLIPHADGMDLLARVLDWDAERLRGEADAPGAAHPLARAGRVHAVHACEYGAQAAAVHGALHARAEGARAAAGLLAALRDVRLHATWIADDAPLDIDVRRLAALPQAAQYHFAVAQHGRALASGVVTIAFATA